MIVAQEMERPVHNQQFQLRRQTYPAAHRLMGRPFHADDDVAEGCDLGKAGRECGPFIHREGQDIRRSVYRPIASVEFPDLAVIGQQKAHLPVSRTLEVQGELSSGLQASPVTALRTDATPSLEYHGHRATSSLDLDGRSGFCEVTTK